MESLIERLNRYAMICAGVILIVCVADISLSAVLRTLFNREIPGTVEISKYYWMVCLATLPIGAVELKREHIIVEIFTQHLRARKRSVLDLFASFLTLIFVAILLYGSIVGAVSATQDADYVVAFPFNIVIWPSRWILVAGLAVMALTVVATIVFSIGALKRREDTN